MKIGTIASGVGTATVFNLTYIPEFLMWTHGTTPQNMRINVAGDGTLFDMDTAGLDCFSAIRLLGRKTSTFCIRLANGLVQNKNVDISITNGVAAAISLYGFSVHKSGTLYFVYNQSYCVALTGREFVNFALLGLPAIAATDILTVEYRDGLLQRFEDAELATMMGMSQSDINGASNEAFDNIDQKIKKVMFTPTSAQTAYTMSYVPVGNMI